MKYLFTRGVLPLMLAAALLAGCDQQKIAKLEEGVATEMDVMREFGTPVDIQRAEDGTRVFEYTRQPEGSTNYFITIGPDGKMTGLRQVLHPSYFAKVQPGMSVADVRRLLGQPAEKQAFELKKEEVWDWRLPPEFGADVFFNIHFDAAGVVTGTSRSTQPRGS